MLDHEFAVTRTRPDLAHAGHLRRPRYADPLTPKQVRRTRDADWLVDHEIGRSGPDGLKRPRSVELIAATYGVGVQTVRDGIDRARKLRSEVHALFGVD